MPIRTTTVVAIGLVALAVIGVGTIFGESLAAWVTPPPASDGPGHTSAAPAPTTSPTPPASSAGSPTRGTRGRDGGVANGGPDGSS